MTLTATPAAGSSFTGWSGDLCTGTGSCVLTMSADRSVTATFDLVPPPAAADLSVTQTDTPDPVTSGNAVRYYLTVTNTGPDAATGVVLEDSSGRRDLHRAKAGVHQRLRRRDLRPRHARFRRVAEHHRCKAPTVAMMTTMTNSATARQRE